MSPAEDLLAFVSGRKFGTVLADPPWRFHNKTGKVAPEHRRLARYATLSFEEIGALPVSNVVT
ncbi:MAG: S-adenosylmethionine-binding protein, partial [Gammaproteobacteria bacterium]|nr:S-adenosylmethionine-binding protein [Gammaproteobacteria bacterium]